MLQIGMQTRNIVFDDKPLEGFLLLKDAGFDCADFSLNGYLDNKKVYNGDVSGFFDKTVEELEAFLLRIRRLLHRPVFEFIRCICHIRCVFRKAVMR